MQPGQDAARESSVPYPFKPDVPALLLPADGHLALPSNDQFRLILASAQQAGTLPDLHKTVSAMQSAAEKMKLAFTELRRLAVFRLQTERAIGVLLMQTVCHGGNRSRSPGRILKGARPDWVTPNQSSAYQRLASIPADVFQRYLDESAEKRVIPSAAGARRFAYPDAHADVEGKRAQRASWSGLQMSQEIVEASMRCLGSCDVLVGSARVDACAQVKALTQTTALTGNILVATGCDSQALVNLLSKGTAVGRISQAIAILPLDPSAEWFQSLGGLRASMCFLRRGEAVVTHLGRHAQGFALVMREHGMVAQGCAPTGA